MKSHIARPGLDVGCRRGDVVRVRSLAEILATLDANATVDGLPFMPEMARFCGQELPVYARADKTCDTIEGTGTTRRMDSTVHLVGARCDGSAHGGCQAGCLLYWREEWLERAPTAAGQAPAPGSAPASALLAASTRSGADAFRCQATELLRASTPLSPREVRQYVLDVRTGNASLRTVVSGLAIEAFNKFQRFSVKRLPKPLRIRAGRPFPFYRGRGSGERTPRLHLRPGELVEVKSKAEIMATLGSDNRNRGMLFDSEMLPYCSRRARVVRQVERILDERTGKMVKLSDCVVLEDVVCLGLYHRFCQRAITPYWREAWLRRVPEPGQPSKSRT